MNLEGKVVRVLHSSNYCGVPFEDIRKEDTFFVGGNPYMAREDAHRSGDASYDGYLIYDTDGNSWFPGDVDMVAKDRYDPDGYIPRLIRVAEQKNWTVMELSDGRLQFSCKICGWADYAFIIKGVDICAEVEQTLREFDPTKWVMDWLNDKQEGRKDVPGIHKLCDSSVQIQSVLRILKSSLHNVPVKGGRKNLWMRWGVDVPCTDREYQILLSGGEDAAELLKEKAANGEFRLNGESYAPICSDDDCSYWPVHSPFEIEV